MLSPGKPKDHRIEASWGQQRFCLDCTDVQGDLSLSLMHNIIQVFSWCGSYLFNIIVNGNDM